MDRQGPKGFGSRISLATAVPLHFCCCHFSLVFAMAWVNLRGFPNVYKVVRFSHGNIMDYKAVELYL